MRAFPLGGAGRTKRLLFLALFSFLRSLLFTQNEMAKGSEISHEVSTHRRNKILGEKIGGIFDHVN